MKNVFLIQNVKKPSRVVYSHICDHVFLNLSKVFKKENDYSTVSNAF